VTTFYYKQTSACSEVGLDLDLATPRILQCGDSTEQLWLL